MNWWFVGGVFVGANVGIVVGACLRYISWQDEDAIAYRALRAVHNENAGLSSQTRAIVIDAIVEHDSRAVRR